MASLMLLLFLLSGAASDTVVVTVHPGDDAILPCQAANSSISVVKWTRDNMQPEYVLFNIDGHLDPTLQHPFFKGRVDLVDGELKNGNVSLILRNVSTNDQGTYECRVKIDGSKRKKRAINTEPIRTIRTIRLQVPEPAGQKSGRPKDENSMNDAPQDGNSSPVGRYHGLAAGISVGLILVAVAVLGALTYRRRNTPSVPPAATDEALATTLV